MSAVESISPEAFAVVAFDEVLKRSRADVLRILLEPHPASSTAMPDNTAALTFARICFIFLRPFFSFVFLATTSRQLMRAKQDQGRSAWRGSSINIIFEARIQQMILPGSVDA